MFKINLRNMELQLLFFKKLALMPVLLRAQLVPLLVLLKELLMLEQDNKQQIHQPLEQLVKINQPQTLIPLLLTLTPMLLLTLVIIQLPLVEIRLLPIALVIPHLTKLAQTPPPQIPTQMLRLTLRPQLITLPQQLEVMLPRLLLVMILKLKTTPLLLIALARLIPPPIPRLTPPLLIPRPTQMQLLTTKLTLTLPLTQRLMMLPSQMMPPRTWMRVRPQLKKCQKKIPQETLNGTHGLSCHSLSLASESVFSSYSEQRKKLKKVKTISS